MIFQKAYLQNKITAHASSVAGIFCSSRTTEVRAEKNLKVSALAQYENKKAKGLVQFHKEDHEEKTRSLYKVKKKSHWKHLKWE